MVAYHGCHKKLQFWLKFLVLSNVFWNIFMLSRTKCLLNNNPLLNPLLTFICHFFERRSSVLDWAFDVDDLLPDLVLRYSNQYLFVYVGILSGDVYFLSDFLLEIVDLLVGIQLNPLLPRKAHKHESMFFPVSVSVCW